MSLCHEVRICIHAFKFLARSDKVQLECQIKELLFYFLERFYFNLFASLSLLAVY